MSLSFPEWLPFFLLVKFMYECQMFTSSVLFVHRVPSEFVLMQKSVRARECERERMIISLVLFVHQVLYMYICACAKFFFNIDTQCHELIPSIFTCKKQQQKRIRRQ